MRRNRPAIDSVIDRLLYNALTGVITWAVNVGSHGRVKAGTESGTLSKSDGYRYVRFSCGDGKKRSIPAHHIAWAMTHGEWPQDEIDHINGCGTDNRIDNLRLASRKLNAENKRKAYSNSITGIHGVSRLQNGRYRSEIKVNGKKYHLGVFSTPDAASNAFIQAKRRLHAGCTI